MPAVAGLVLGMLTAPVATGASTAATTSAIGVQASDLPGFSPTSNQTISNPTDQGLVQSFLDCAAPNALLHQFDTGPEATRSELYGQGTGPLGTSAESVFSVVFTDGSASDAAGAYADLTGTAFASCWASEWEAVTTAITGGLATVVTPYHVEPMATPAMAGAQVGGYSLNVTVSALGVTLSDSIGITGIHVGTFATMLVTVSSGQAFPTALRTTLTATIAKRMGASATTTSTPTPTPAESCLRSGIPDAHKPVLTDPQVERIVHGRVQFTGETTNGTTVCVWSRTIPHVTNGSTPVNGTLTWQVAVDGPLSSASAAHRAYQAAAHGATLAVVVPNLGDKAELAAGTTQPRLLVQAGKYFLQFDSVNAPTETQTGILTALAQAVLVRLKLTPATSSHAITHKTWPSDWAGPSFCKDYGQPYQRATFRGVASCGVAYVTGEGTNLTGPVCYPVSHPAGRCRGSKEVVFNLTGFQCVEYALRYFYFVTGIRTTRLDDNGDDVATELYYAFRGKNPQLGLDPLTSKKRAKGQTVGTSRYNPSLVKGDIISMWSAGDEAGHVAVIESTKHLHKKKNGKWTGYVTMVNENAQHGVTRITVTTSKLTYGGGYFTTFQWLTGLPTS